MSTANPLITVFSACRGANDYARRCIASVLDQTYQDWEQVFVVDYDPSHKDMTWRFAWYAAGGDPRIHLAATDTRKFKLANFLTALPHMRGDIIVELDGDDWFCDEDALAKIAAAYAANPATEATCGSHKNYPEGIPITPSTLPCRGWRMQENGFALAFPAPRTWKRSLSLRAAAEFPECYVDPATGAPWQYNADLAIYGPVAALAGHIACLDDIMVEANYAPGTPHDYTHSDGAQREQGLRLHEWWQQKEFELMKAGAKNGY